MQFSDGKLAFSLMGENGTSLLGSIFSLGGLAPVSSFLSLSYLVFQLVDEAISLVL